jgi:hypothetical protein
VRLEPEQGCEPIYTRRIAFQHINVTPLTKGFLDGLVDDVRHSLSVTFSVAPTVSHRQAASIAAAKSRFRYRRIHQERPHLTAGQRPQGGLDAIECPLGAHALIELAYVLGLPCALFLAPHGEHGLDYLTVYHFLGIETRHAEQLLLEIGMKVRFHCCGICPHTSQDDSADRSGTRHGKELLCHRRIVSVFLLAYTPVEVVFA